MVNRLMSGDLRFGGLDPAKWLNLRSLLAAGLGMPANARAEWLSDVCKGDAGLRAELESLLGAGSGASFLDRPALEHVALDWRDPEGDTVVQALPTDRDAVPAGTMIGHYRISEKLGEGGMGAVYKAQDTRLGRPAAIKIITGFDGSGREKRLFFREARAASALNHPNIVTIYEYNSEAGRDYIAMEYLEGNTLGHLIPAGGLPRETLVSWGSQIAAALARAHDAGIVHRDLKPSNVMVTGAMVASDGLVKILDFGIAAQAAPAGQPGETQTITVGDRIAGTPAYMAPEQIMGGQTGPLSDIFSFGIMLYEMACGHHPFKGPDRVATMTSIVREPAPSPAEINPAIDPRILAVIEQCLRKNPSERPQSMTEIRSGLQAALVSPTTETASPERPRRWRALHTGVAVATCVFGLAAALWYGGQNTSPKGSTLTWSLQAQRPGGGPYTALPTEVFHGGDKFRLHFEAPQAGSLYVINEGPGAGGTRRFWILYPAVSGTAALGAGQSLDTPWYAFDLNAGTERLWVAFAPGPVEALQTALAGSDQGEVKDAAAAAKIGDFLKGAGKPSRTVVPGSGVRLHVAEGALGEMVELWHQ